MQLPSLVPQPIPAADVRTEKSTLPPLPRHFAASCQELLARARNGSGEAVKYLKEEGYTDPHKAETKILFYEAITSLLHRTLGSSGWVPKETVQEWNGVLASLAAVLKNDVNEAAQYDPVMRALTALVQTPQQISRIQGVFRRLDGGLRRTTSPTRLLAFTLLNDLEGAIADRSLTQADAIELKDLKAPPSPRTALEELGRIIINRWAAGSDEGINFVKRELAGPEVKLNNFDREAILYFALKQLAARTIITYENGSGDEIVQRAREWNSAFKTIEDLCMKGKRGLVHNVASPLRAALQATSVEFGKRTASLTRTWDSLLEERYAKLGREMLGIARGYSYEVSPTRRGRKAA